MRVDDVLDAGRHAVERRPGLLPVALPGFGQRGLRVEMDPGADRLIARLDMREAGFDQPLGSQVPRPDGGGGVKAGEEMGLGHACLAKLRPMSWRWIWFVPSQIWVILASRSSRSARYSLI